MKLFFGEINKNIATLSEEESYHFSKVLRGREKEIIHVTDGKGNLATIEVDSISKKSVEGKVIDLKTDYQKKGYYLHIAIAPTKTTERLEFFLEKATEIGIDEISFLHTFHSERKNIKIDRIEKIVRSATKQSLKAFFPKINNLIKLNEFLKQDFDGFVKCIAHCDSDEKRIPLKTILNNQPRKILILIGPEGDFSKDEISSSAEEGFTSISLGDQRFRTETAALQAVFAVDWELNRL